MVTSDNNPPGTAALRKSLNDLILEARAVREDVQEDQRQRREVAATLRRSVKIALAAVAFCLVLLAAVLAMVIQNNRIAAAAESAARDARKTSELIADCTIAGGKCQGEQAKRTGAAVGAIGRTQLYIVECSRELGEGSGPAWDARFEKCVADRLKRPPAVK